MFVYISDTTCEYLCNFDGAPSVAQSLYQIRDRLMPYVKEHEVHRGLP